MEMALQFNELAADELCSIDGGVSAYDVGYVVGVVLGVAYDAMVVVRAVYTGSF